MLTIITNNFSIIFLYSENYTNMFELFKLENFILKHILVVGFTDSTGVTIPPFLPPGDSGLLPITAALLPPARVERVEGEQDEQHHHQLHNPSHLHSSPGERSIPAGFAIFAFRSPVAEA